MLKNFISISLFCVVTKNLSIFHTANDTSIRLNTKSFEKRSLFPPKVARERLYSRHVSNGY